MFFVTLHVDMKALLIKLSALLMVLWYSMSIIGFDVHTCSGSGKSFIATFVSGTECDDIHPDHVCGKGTCQAKAHHEGCCEAHSCAHGCSDEDCDGVKIMNKSCCTDDYQVIMLTGVPSDDHGFRYEAPCFTFCPFVDLFSESQKSYSQGLTAFLKPDLLPDVRKDFQAVMNIWRI